MESVTSTSVRERHRDDGEATLAMKAWSIRHDLERLTQWVV